MSRPNITSVPDPAQPGSFAEYKGVYETLLTPDGLKSLNALDESTKADLLAKINTFLNVYPHAEAAASSKNITKMSLMSIYKGCMKVVIDIINDVSQTISEKDALSNAEFRRNIFKAFTGKDRVFYVGIWLLIIAFIVYFIDISD